MRRIVHVSDLHFGRDRPELLKPLLAAIAALDPDLVAVSGDLTQRARPDQFRAARAFLDALGAPWISVPGNHDVPLYNVLARWTRPFARYRAAISRDLEPGYADPGVVVVGLNTVDPMAWQRGRAWPGRIERACKRLASVDASDTRTRVLLVHHPFEHLPNEPKELMRDAAAGMDRLTACGVDIVLSGHLHAWRADPVARRIGGDVTLQVQAGTGLSTRQRGEENDFNLLEIERDAVRVIRHAVTSGGTGFVAGTPAGFLRRDGQWCRAG